MGLFDRLGGVVDAATSLLDPSRGDTSPTDEFLRQQQENLAEEHERALEIERKLQVAMQENDRPLAQKLEKELLHSRGRINELLTRLAEAGSGLETGPVTSASISKLAELEEQLARGNLSPETRRRLEAAYEALRSRPAEKQPANVPPEVNLSERIASLERQLAQATASSMPADRVRALESQLAALYEARSRTTGAAAVSSFVQGAASQVNQIAEAYRRIDNLKQLLGEAALPLPTQTRLQAELTALQTAVTRIQPTEQGLLPHLRREMQSIQQQLARNDLPEETRQQLSARLAALQQALSKVPSNSSAQTAGQQLPNLADRFKRFEQILAQTVLADATAAKELAEQPPQQAALRVPTTSERQKTTSDQPDLADRIRRLQEAQARTDLPGATRTRLESELSALLEAQARQDAARPREEPKPKKGPWSEAEIRERAEHIARQLQDLSLPAPTQTRLMSELSALQEALYRAIGDGDVPGDGDVGEAPPSELAGSDLDAKILELEERLADPNLPPATATRLQSELAALKDAAFREQQVDLSLPIPEALSDESIQDERIREFLAARFEDRAQFGTARTTSAKAPLGTAAQRTDAPVDLRTAQPKDGRTGMAEKPSTPSPTTRRPPAAQEPASDRAAALVQQVLASFYGTPAQAAAGGADLQAKWTQTALNHLVAHQGDVAQAARALERSMLASDASVFPVLKDARSLFREAAAQGRLSASQLQQAERFLARAGVADLPGWIRGVVERHPNAGKDDVVRALFVEGMRYVQRGPHAAARSAMLGRAGMNPLAFGKLTVR